MPTASDVARLQRSQRDIQTIARREATALWRSFDLADPIATRDALEAFLPPMVTLYGDVTATVAADWYDEVRASTGVRGRYVAQPAVPPAADAVRANARWAIGPLFSAAPDRDAALAQLTAELDRMVLQPGRDTITQSAGRDPQAAGWQRITRPGACKFCVALADRGAVYKRSTVRFAAHTNCDCQVAPSWDASAPEVSVEAYRASSRDRDNAATRAWLNREYPDLPG